MKIKFKKYFAAIIAFGILVLLNSCDNNVSEHNPGNGQGWLEGLTCTIKAANDTVSLNDNIAISIIFENKTDSNLYLTYILDGSWWKFRYPYCCFEIIHESGDTIEAGGRICGVTNPLEPGNFKLVNAGENFTQSQYGSIIGFYKMNMLKKGKYTFQYIYDTRSNDFNQWSPFSPDENDLAEIKRLVGLMPKILIKSNKIVIYITE